MTPVASGLVDPVPQSGERISGWVAANCRTIANSDAILDVDDRVNGLRLALAAR
jgi:hypothetical protein